jgi:recombination protein U
MKYPNSKKSYTSPKQSYSNRGMSLENDLNKTNEYYLTNNIAVIYKKPTPIQIVKVDYPKRSAAKITEAYFKVPSTTDYNGIYKGKYIDFEAKECLSKTLFPFSFIHPHQVKHLSNVLNHGAIAFIILRMSNMNEDYLIKADNFINYYNSGVRKSLPLSWIEENGHKISSNYFKPCDYLSVVDQVFKF